MAWLESHGNLARHPKTRRLMQRMGWTLPFTIGNLHLLWYWALEFAPTGDLTKFAPEDLTYDLDLGDSTPEQFLQALVESGFLDRSADGVIRLHDWPEYTNKCLRPKYRRYPERWHQVLRSYGLPVITRRRTTNPSRPAVAGAEIEPNKVEHGPQGAGRVDCVEDAARQGEASGRDRSQMALQAVRRDPTSVIAEPEPQATPTLEHPEFVSSNNESDRPELSSNLSAISAGDLSTDNAPINLPKHLLEQPGFTEWWPKFLQVYQDKGSALTSIEQGKLLQRLERLDGKPHTATQMLKTGVENHRKAQLGIPITPIRPRAAPA